MLAMSHSNMELAIHWGRRIACVVLSGDGWTRRSVSIRVWAHRGSTEWMKLCIDGCESLSGCILFVERVQMVVFLFKCCSSWDEIARLICVCGGGAIPHSKYRSSTLVGLRHPEMTLQGASMTRSIFEACDDLLQTGDAYSAKEKHRARAVVRIVWHLFPSWCSPTS